MARHDVTVERKAVDEVPEDPAVIRRAAAERLRARVRALEERERARAGRLDLTDVAEAEARRYPA